MSRVRSMFGLNKFCSWSMFEGGAGVINMTLTWKNRACGEQYTNPLSQHHPQGTSNLARIQNVVDVASGRATKCEEMHYEMQRRLWTEHEKHDLLINQPVFQEYLSGQIAIV
jgi:hypothetical protein